MNEIQKVIDTADHVAMQLEKAHSVLDEVRAYFISEHDREFLPVAAEQINNLLNVVNDYVLDATGAANTVVKKAQRMIDLVGGETADEYER